MRLSWLLLPLALLGFAGCVDVHEHPGARHETLVTPAPAPPPTVYATPGTSTTVVTRP